MKSSGDKVRAQYIRAVCLSGIGDKIEVIALNKRKSLTPVAAQRHWIGCGGRIWTYDLRVMSPTSYQTAPPRDHLTKDAIICEWGGYCQAFCFNRLFLCMYIHGRHQADCLGRCLTNSIGCPICGVTRLMPSLFALRLSLSNGSYQGCLEIQNFPIWAGSKFCALKSLAAWSDSSGFMWI